MRTETAKIGGFFVRCCARTPETIMMMAAV